MASEYLVMGARLRCFGGSGDQSPLIVLTDEICINNRPRATVTDSEVGVNILGFGRCSLAGGVKCIHAMELADEWDNTETVNCEVNGDRAITMSSVLRCISQGTFIEPVTSGQDCSDILEMLKALLEMEDMFPGLGDLLDDLHASLLLSEGMRELALDFLEHMLYVRGGEIELLLLFGFDIDNALNDRILSAVIKLTRGHGADARGLFDHLQMVIARTGLNNGASPGILNDLLMEHIRADSMWLVGLMEQDNLHGRAIRSSEENIARGSFLSGLMNEVLENVFQIRGRPPNSSGNMGAAPPTQLRSRPSVRQGFSFCHRSGSTGRWRDSRGRYRSAGDAYYPSF